MSNAGKRHMQTVAEAGCVIGNRRLGQCVAAHSNSLAHGRGIGHKAPDYYVAYLCQRCHDEVDGRVGGLSKEEKRERWLSAFLRTVALWFEEGLVK
jgi:hypothetical protein